MDKLRVVVPGLAWVLVVDLGSKVRVRLKLDDEKVKEAECQWGILQHLA